MKVHHPRIWRVRLRIDALAGAVRDAGCKNSPFSMRDFAIAPAIQKSVVNGVS